jgi:CDP-glucose 4,6-dehydratase
MNLALLKNKKILITGNTGFKGSWLSLLLLKYGAKVYGISNSIPPSPSLFELAGLKNEIHQVMADVCNPDTKKEFESIRPDIIFHLAAQPILIEGIREPRFTIENNISAMITVLEYLRKPGVSCTALFITSDKCYQNQEWAWSYRETDVLGGKEPYGASKAACEIIYASYYQTYFKYLTEIRTATVRAGNVIGGGDFSENRIIPDCIRAWQLGKPVTIRNENAVRPWQHVLEPLSGYLHLCINLIETDGKFNGEAFNFGPAENAFHKVADVTYELSSHLQISTPNPLFISGHNSENQEAILLKISSEKANFCLGWKPKLGFRESIKLTADWYNAFTRTPSQIRKFTDQQIEEYLLLL